jgi:putative heme-binding domain-containing protein
MIAAGRDEMELGRSLALLKSVGPDIQVAVLNGVVMGRKNAPRRPLTQATTREMLAFLAASPSSGVRNAARAVEETFLSGVDNPLTMASLPPIEKVSPAEFRKFRQALSQPRNPERGGEIFRQACALCHRVDGEGHDVGPDLMGQAGMPEESLLQDIIAPNSRIRPGFETTLIDLEKGVEANAAIGLLKDDGATSLTLAAPGGLQQVFLRKDILGVRRVAQSMMPSFAEGLTPAEVADVLAWLRSRLNAKAIEPAKP